MKNFGKKSVILLFGFLLFSCGGSKSNKDILIYAMFKDAINLDPAVLSDTQSNIIVTNICEGLVGYKDEETTVRPLLADSWKISSDGKTYTFLLNKNAKFSDGSPVNADAVLFSLLRQNDKKHPFYVKSAYWEAVGLSKNILSINKLDEHTVEIKLNLPDATFLSKLSIAVADIINPAAYKKMGEEAFAKKPSCSGPFKIVSWKKGQQIVLDRNDNYWNKENMPKVKKVIVKIIPDASARALALQKGEVDIAEMIQPQDADKIKQSKDLSFVEKPVLYQNYLWFNIEKAPFNNVKVRQAVAHLVDKKALMKGATQGYGKVAVNQIPTSMWGYDNSIVDYSYNVEMAKQLLSEAGYPNGFEMDISYNKEDAGRKIAAEILQNELIKANIKVNLKTYEWGTFLDLVMHRKYTGGNLSGWGADYMDPDDYLAVQFTSRAAAIPGLNLSGWKNSEFDNYIYQATKITDQHAREMLYSKAQQIMHKEVPVITLYERVVLIGMKKNVKNFYFSPLTIARFYKVEKE